MRSQLSRMPGEERKFRRRRIVACIPGCKRERDAAASQAALVEGVAAVEVGAGLITGVLVGAGRAVAVGASGLVAIGEGRGVAVGEPGCVSVGEGKEVVCAGSIVPVGDRDGRGVDPSKVNVDVARAATGLGLSVTEGVKGIVSVR